MQRIIPAGRVRTRMRFSLWILAVGAVFGLALALRLACLDCSSLWMDEVDSIALAQHGIGAIFSERFGLFANQTPWHYVLVWLTIQPVDPALTSGLVRLPSALAGALLVPATFALGWEWFGRSAGLLAGVLVAGSTTLLGVSQDARPYALLALFTVLSVYCFEVAWRTGHRRWWIAWAGATIANLLNSYAALTLAMPALVLGWGWLLLQLAARRDRYPSLRYVLSACVAIGLVAADAVFELSQLAKVAPDLTQSGSMRTTALTIFRDWLAQGNVPSDLRGGLQAACWLVAGIGSVVSLAGDGRARRGMVFAGLLVLIPLALVCALGTTNTVAARYVAFTLPFFYLLVGQGFRVLLAGLTMTWPRRRWIKIPAATFSLWVLILGSGALLVYAESGAEYYSTTGYSATRFKPDYRAAAAYLAGRVAPADTIVFLDDPPHGVDVSRFYWHWHAPAHVYDARDPRLATVVPQGKVYWVIGLFYYAPRQLAALAAQDWPAQARFPAVAVLQDPDSGAGIVDRLDGVVRRLQQVDGCCPALSTIAGSVAQDRGQASQALRSYAVPGGRLGFLGPEHLRTSRGFAALGDTERAWQQAMLSKYNQADSPDLHRWLAQLLAQAGDTVQSQIETQLAADLTRPPTAAPGQRPGPPR